VFQEPPEAAAFFSAYRLGDETTAEQVASPLYLKEWARRKVPFDHRLAWVQYVRAENATAADWIDVSYAKGVFADGQGHLLYIGRSTQPGRTARQSVWRLDTDSTGRVIWAEMVWLFSDATNELTIFSDLAEPAQDAFPPVFQRMHPEAVYGIHSATGWEGYYGVRHLAGDKPVYSFFAVDEYGQIRVGAWTYYAT
jgi:hypothetical protein